MTNLLKVLLLWNHMSKLATIIVHLQESYRPYFKHPSGDVSQGLENVARLMRTSAKANVPVIVAELEGNGETVPQVKNLIPETRAQKIVSGYMSILNDPQIVRNLKAREIEGVILAGFNKYACVWFTAQDAARNGLWYRTSSDVLFYTSCNEWSIRKEGENHQFIEEEYKKYPLGNELS